MLLFDEGEPELKETLKLQFVAITQRDAKDKQIAKAVLKGSILKHQSRQSLQQQQEAKGVE